MNLTPEQAKVLDFVVETQKATGAPPTVREIAKHFGYASPNNASQHLRLIEAKGYIRRTPGRARGLVVTEARRFAGQTDAEGVAGRRVPIVGRIAAGEPIESDPVHDAGLTLDADLFRGGNLMSVRVIGDSMTGAGIMNGDYAVIQQQANVEDGEIAAVLLENDVTLKRVYRQGGRLVLQAENPAHSDIHVDETTAVRILGKLKGIVRTC